jgi:WD40 repeat protein
MKFFQETYKLKLRKQFDGHSFGIGCIAWCPFSRYIIACGTDECNEIWIWDVEVGNHYFLNEKRKIFI